MASGETREHFVVANSCKSHGRDAAAVLAVRISSELAGRDFGFQIGRDGVGSAGEDAVIWTRGRRDHLPNQ